MTTAKRLFPAALLCVLGLSAQESPGLFQLWLPDLFQTPFPGSNNVIDTPARKIQRINILVRDAQARNIRPGSYKITVNGKGLGNVFDERTTLEGTLLVMDLETLRKRPDELFDPRENAIEVVAEDRRGRRYYQNWIVRVNDTNQNALFGYSSSASPDDPGAVPPDLVILEPTLPPAPQPNQKSLQVVLKGLVSSGASLKIDGHSVPGPKPGDVGSFEYTATVTPAERELIIEASDGKGGSRRAIIPIYWPGTSAPRARFAGQKYAVLIGISQFGPTSQAPPPLRLAAAETQAFARTLETQGGFRPENIRLLTDEKATLQSVRVALSDFASKAQPSDILIVYITTHGLHDPRPNRGDELYLALHGTQLSNMDATALPFSDLELLLNRSVRTNQCFLIFDVGHELSGDWQFRAGQNLVNNRALNLFGDKSGWSILVSASSGQTSTETPVDGRASSLFSYWLSHALGGEADLNGDHVITAGELFRFVSEKVRDGSQGRQQPRFRLPAGAADQPISGK